MSEFDPELSADDLDNFTQLREYAKRQEKLRKERERELAELREELAQLRAERMRDAAKAAAAAAGLTAEQTEALLRFRPDATPEDVKMLADVFRSKPASEEQSAQSTQPAADETSSSTAQLGATQPAPPGGPVFTPATGSPGAQGPVSWEQIKQAIARGDDAFLRQVAAEAAAGRPLDLGPYAHMIGPEGAEAVLGG